MTLSYFQSDKSVLARIEGRRTAAAYRQQAVPTQDLAQRIDALYRAYPHMDAGQIVSLATAGLDPSNPVVQEIADMSFEQKRKSGVFDKVGDLLGGVASTVGKPLGALARGVDTAMGGVDESLAPGAKAAVRTGFVVLESGLQEMQTFIRAGGYAGVKLAQDQGDTSALNKLRNIVDPTRWDDYAETFAEAHGDAGSSSAREAIAALARGDRVNLGSGFLPAGEVEETVKARANRLSINVGNVTFGGPGNQSITPGRVLAAKVSEPGDAAFNILSGLVDGGVAWFGDPAAALAGVAKTARVGNRARRAGHALRAGESLAGAADELAHLGQFAPVVDRSLQSRAAEGLGDMIDSVTGRVSSSARKTVQPDLVDSWLTKGGRRVVEKLAESDYHTIRSATGGKLGESLNVRLADATTPQEVEGILRPALGTQLRDAPEFLGFKARPGVTDRIRLLQSMPGSHIDPGDLDGAVGQVDRWLRNAKVNPELRRESLERLARTGGQREMMVATMGDIMGKAADDMAERIKPGQSRTSQVRARKLTTMFNADFEKSKAYFVDAIAEDRRVNGVIVAGQSLDLQSPHMMTEYLNSVIPLPEAREIRRATSTLSRLVDNPMFETTSGVLDGLQGKWKQLALMRGAYTVRVVGEEQIRMAASGHDSMFAHPFSFISALLGDENAARKMATGKVRQADVLGDHFSDIDEMKNALVRGQTKWDTDGRIFDQSHTLFRPGEDGYERAWAEGVSELANDPVARKIAEAQGNLDDVKDWFWRRQGRKFRKSLVTDKPELATQAGSDQWVTTAAEIVEHHTRGDTVLLDAIASGVYAGEKVAQQTAGGKWHLSDTFLEHFTGAVGPEAVKGQRIVGHADDVKRWDQATGWIFNHLMTRPTNYLSRNPTFRSMYWQRIEEMLPYMDDATRAKAMAGAEGVVDKAALKRMRQMGPSDNRTIVDLADADILAKAHALDGTKKLLYDASERGQFFDAFRHIFPFGEAWKEVVTRWAKIGMENPRTLRRGQQVINSARGNGFFHKDTNGEEVFTYPFSRQISKALIGMPVDLTGRVAGLSLMTEVLPGVGPVVQVPAAALIPDGSEWNWAREFVSPYGEADYSNGFLESMLPGYTKNIGQAFGIGDERMRANTVMAVYDYLASTGDYDLANPDDTQRLMDDANSMGGKLYGLRGMAQFFSPTSPLPQTLIEGEKGDELLVRREVIADLYRLQEEHGYEDGIDEFVERYGVEMLAATQGATVSIPPMLPVTKQASDWVRDHGDIVKRYGLTWGMFAPPDAGEIDFAEYSRQIDAKDRKPLTVEERALKANQRVGRYIFEQASKKVSEKPTKAEREWLSAIKDKLREEYPGYGRLIGGVPTGAQTEDVVAELARAVNDPKLSSTEQAAAARLYLQARDKALAFASEIGVKTLEAQAAAPAREWLGSVGKAIAQKYPSFQGVFENVFSREVE